MWFMNYSRKWRSRHEWFCRWYGKDMEDVTEHEQEQCEENGQDCRECPDLVIKEQEAAGHERYNTDS